jgi:cupin fold WbuC family metalloprotein
MPAATSLGSDELIEAGPGIFYARRALPLLDDRMIELLKETARSIPRRRARFCAHPSPDAEQHDMVIASHRDTYVAPHRHLANSESFTVIEGNADLLLFDEGGGLRDIVKMGPPASGLPFFYRMPPGRFHSLSIDSELLVFVESTKGPFLSDNSENARWAPAPDDIAAGRAFIASLLVKPR